MTPRMEKYWIRTLMSCLRKRVLSFLELMDQYQEMQMKNIGHLYNEVMIYPESDQIADLIIHQNLLASIIKSKGGVGISEMMDPLVLTQ